MLSCFSLSATMLTDFAQSDALLKRFPPGLYADEIVPIDYMVGAQTIVDAQEGEVPQFIGLVQQQRTSVPQGAVLIVHDVGQNANWPRWVQPIRNYLPDIGWMTLSITIPSGKLYDQRSYEQMINDRIGASINYLQNNAQFNLVLIGTGTGSYWVAKYLSEYMQEVDDFGFSMISINGHENSIMQTEKFSDYLSQLTIPILDLYLPKNEYESKQAKWRKGIMLSSQHP